MTVTRFLDPLTLARIDNLDLVARTVVNGFVHGLHQSPHLVVSTASADHRPYLVADDIRRTDWRVYGRAEPPHANQYTVETHANMWVLLDISGPIA